MTVEEAIKWLVSGIWEQDIETTEALAVIIEALREKRERESGRAQPEITGETSDGYHTFNELYRHRAVLFSVICNDRPVLAWKSKLHHDGTMYDGMFIVGIQTPEGQATYHYDVNPYWVMFRVPELPQAPEWDGHTPAQAIERIGKLCTELKNEPLTLDELRGMVGEPVWMARAKKWVFVSTVVTEPYAQVWYFFKGFVYAVLYYHEKFYRNKPERSEG